MRVHRRDVDNRVRGIIAPVQAPEVIRRRELLPLLNADLPRRPCPPFAAGAASAGPQLRSNDQAHRNGRQLEPRPLLLLLSRPADVKVVQQMLGHKSAIMTLDLYGHLFADQLDEVPDRLDVAARAARVAPVLPDAQVIKLATGTDGTAGPDTRGV